jgi:hypothetical protein
MSNIPATIKRQPAYNQETHTCRQCNKCGGTGFYCMGVENGRPYSYTGFACRLCGGKGWQIRPKKAPKSALKSGTLVGSRAWIEEQLSSGKYDVAKVYCQYTD